MPKGLQASFTSGELTPSLHRRSDLDKYLKGLATCRNFFVHPHGGVSNRSGSEFIVETKDSTKASRLISFAYNTEDTYALEFGEYYMRVVRQGGQMILQTTPSAWVTATAYAVTDHVESGGTYYYCFLAHTSGASSEPGVGGSWATYWYALTSDIVEIPTNFTEAQLFEVTFLQSADIITMCHRSHPVAELSRTAHDKWKITNVTFQPTISAPTGLGSTGGTGSVQTYVVTAISEDNGEESVPSASTTGNDNGGLLAWTAVSGAESYAIYKLKNGIYGFIGVAEGVNFTDEIIIPESTDTPPSVRNPFASAGNYPATATYHEQRLCFANTINAPQKIWMSQTANFHNFNVSRPTKADDAITVRIDASQVNTVRHLTSLDDLMVLTSGAVHKITSGDSAFAFVNLRTKPQSYTGVAAVPPIVVDNTILYIQARGAEVRDLAYALETDGYSGKTVAILSQHLFKNYTMVDWAFAKEPENIVWIVRNDGTLLGMTNLKEQEVLAWHRHDTDGSFESVCSVSEGQIDAVYVIVNRTINGVTKRYIERMHDRYFADISDAFFVDSGLQYTGPTATVSGVSLTDPVVMTAVGHPFFNGDRVKNFGVLGTTEVNGKAYTIANATADTYELVGVDGTGFTAYISGGIAKKVVDDLSGLGHLEGKTVSILADGNVHPQRVVTSGAISLNYEVNKVIVGLPIVGQIKTLEPPFEGTAANPKTAQSIDVGILDSRGLFAGPDEDHLAELKQRSTEDWGDPTRVKTGYVNIIIESSWENNGQLLLQQTDPLPITILSIVPDYDIGS